MPKRDFKTGNRICTITENNADGSVTDKPLPQSSLDRQRLLVFSQALKEPPLALFVVMLSKAYLTSHSRMSGSR